MIALKIAALFIVAVLFGLLVGAIFLASLDALGMVELCRWPYPDCPPT